MKKETIPKKENKNYCYKQLMFSQIQILLKEENLDTLIISTTISVFASFNKEHENNVLNLKFKILYLQVLYDLNF